jgi:hypothetical protein
VSRADQLSVAVRLPAAGGSAAPCVEALRCLPGVRIRRLRECDSIEDLDLILDLTSLPAEPRLIAAARFGYWTFLHGEIPQRIPAGLLEILSGQRAAFVRLARLLPDGKAEILREGCVKTVTHSLSRTRRRLREASSRWPAEKLAQLMRDGAAARGPAIELPRRGVASPTRLRARVPAALLRNLARLARQRLTREHWRVGIIERPIAQVARDFNPAEIRWLDVPFDGFLADPFGLVRPDGRLTILAEAFAWKERRGHIGAIERGGDGTFAVGATSLRFDTHLSYPQLIEHQGELYCLPESAARGCVQLFRAAEFPGRWLADRVLLEGFAGADSTVVRYRDRWWMFTCNHSDQDEAKLFVFHSPALRGPWTPHALNPVKCDLRSSRPAGTPFVGEDGALYRPAQDCSRVYGGALAINRITRLTAEEFEEEVVAYLRPDPAGPCPDGLHTLSAAGEVTLVDGKRHEPPAPFAAALGWLRRHSRWTIPQHGQDRIRQPAA